MNLIEAANEAKENGIKVIGFLGKTGGELVRIADIVLHVKVTVPLWFNRLT